MTSRSSLDEQYVLATMNRYWTYAPKRDEDRRHHNRFVTFDEVKQFSGEVEKDIEQVRELLRTVVAIDIE